MPRINDNSTRKRFSEDPGVTPEARSQAAAYHAGNLVPVDRTSSDRDSQQRRPGSSFAARFGRVILQHGVAALPSALYHFQGELDLSVVQVWFVSYILTHKWDADLPYPSLHKMARSTGMTYVNLQRIKARLCEMNYLKVVRRISANGGLDSSAYDFSPLFARLEKFIQDAQPLPNSIREEGPAADLARLADMDPSFVARYGRVLIRRGVATVPWAVYTHQAQLGLSPYHVWFVTYIFSFQWDTGLPYPSLVKMSSLTGYSLSRIHEIKGELVKLGYLNLIGRSNSEGGQDTNAYDFSGLLDAVRYILQPAESKQLEASIGEDETLEPGQNNTIAGSEQSMQEEETQYLPRGAAPRRGRKSKSILNSAGLSSLPKTPGNTERTAPSNTHRIASNNTDVSYPSNTERIEASNIYSVGGIRRLRPGVVTSSGEGLVTRAEHEIETLKEEPEQEDDSNRYAPNSALKPKVIAPAKTGIPGYSPYIAAIISDFSRELGDAVHELSNMKQALNLWQSSGLKEQDFVEIMQEARQLTRKYQNRPTWDAMSNKMAYFFACLRGMVLEPAPEEN